jgi:hypothetical protein
VQNFRHSSAKHVASSARHGGLPPGKHGCVHVQLCPRRPHHMQAEAVGVRASFGAVQAKGVTRQTSQRRTLTWVPDDVPRHHQPPTWHVSIHSIRFPQHSLPKPTPNNSLYATHAYCRLSLTPAHINSMGSSNPPSPCVPLHPAHLHIHPLPWINKPPPAFETNAIITCNKLRGGCKGGCLEWAPARGREVV